MPSTELSQLDGFNKNKDKDEDNISNDSNYNNIIIAPKIVNQYKTIYPFIKKINTFNEHQIEKRQIMIDDDNHVVRYMFTNPNPILIHFNINETFTIIDTLPLMDSILLSSIPVYTIIDSICRDAMILPFLVGKKRYMYSYSHIHITTFFYEHTGDTLEDKMVNQQTFRNKIITIFKKYTKIPEKIYKMLFKRELFFDAETCLKYGFIDKII